MGFESVESQVIELSLYLENTREIALGVFKNECIYLLKLKNSGKYTTNEAYGSFCKVAYKASYLYSIEHRMYVPQAFKYSIVSKVAMQLVEWFEDVYKTCPTDIPGYPLQKGE